ncbi:phage tail tape measure protein [Avibacterium paragallinarum]|uniref:phage tail tape measure protein n=1 Tax=Avibacterium paragallinarum TaxID=728 RepID=UPI003977F299
MANMKLSLQLKAQDYASRVMDKLRSNINKANKDIENQAVRSGQKQQETVKRTAQITEQSYRKAQQAARVVASARQSLGVRSENAIQREINQTIAAYQRLKASGTASSREIARAAVVAKQKIAQLNAEMGKVPTGQRLGNFASGMASLGAGAIAGGMVMATPMKKQMSYDRELAMVANTAFSDRDVAGRIAGKKELHEAVKKAVETGGGTKEEALGALDTMLASGAVKAETAMNLLPTLQKAAVATGADTNDLAKIAISAMQQFGISEDQIGLVLDKAVAAGQAGNFELSDMARWLPQQMAAAKSAGLSGMDGFESLLVANQQARVTAGNSDEAGNNLVNLLAKITAKETNERFKKLEIKGKDGKTHGIDFVKSMENEKKQGKDSLQAFMSIMDQVIGEDENYKAIQKKLKTAKKEDQAKLLNEMTNLVEGTAIGQIISDRQALMALLGIRNNVQLGEEVKEKVSKAEGAVETSHAVIKDTNSYKVDDAKNSLEFAQMEGMKGFNNALGDMAVKIADYAKAYPELTTTITTAGTVITALSTAAVAASGALMLLGRRGGRGGLSAGDMLDIGTSVGNKSGKGVMRGVKGFRGLGPLLAFEALRIAGDNYTTQAAIKEEKAEAKTAQQKAAEQRFYQAAYPTGKSTYQWSPSAAVEKSAPSIWAKANGAYAIAEQKQKQEIAEIRLERGSLTQEQYNERINQSTTRIAGLSSPIGLTMPTAEGGTLAKLEPALSNLANYRADFEQFGQTLSDALKQAIESQNFVIQNQIKVDLDGRIVAEQTSEYHYQDLKRWG